MITFVIPCYNEQDYIKACIRSIRQEAALIPHEILVIDNNCTDNTAYFAIYEGAQVIKEPRKGVVYARQTGYEHAKYDLIANIDADSRLYPGWIWTAMGHITKPEVVAVTGPIIYDGASMALRISTRIYYWFALQSNKYIGVFLQGGNALIKKKALDKTNGYDLSIAFYGEDTMTAKRLEESGKIIFEPSLFIYSSPRRLEDQGVIKTTWLYLTNYLSVTFKGKSTTDDYKDFR
jgi:glycosyltransferase involved in cell wall biosynthesis